jgi:hypothetical protein
VPPLCGDVQRRAPGVGRAHVGAFGQEQHRQLAIPCTDGRATVSDNL